LNTIHWFKSYFFFDSYVKTHFLVFIYKFYERVALRIKFFTYTIKHLINIRVKVHLDPFSHYLPKSAAK